MSEAQVWRPVVGWEDAYEVSDSGGVRSIARNWHTTFGLRSYGGCAPLTRIKAKNGYALVNLTCPGHRKQCLVHRLVLLAFCGPPPAKGMQACHNNGDRFDNRLSNLRWDTVKGNHADKLHHGTAQIGERNPLAKLTADNVRWIRTLSYRDAMAAAETLGVSRGCVQNVLYKQTWKHVA